MPLLLTLPAPSGNHPHPMQEILSPDKLIEIGQHFLFDILPKIVVICVMAWVMIRVLTFFTDRMVKIAERHAAAPTRISQTRTLSSVLRATGIAVVSFLAVMWTLPLLGFNLEPLLASAGVAGVAIGLACQTVVKDCLNGMLILVEDQYNVGDVITIASLTGTVEAMSLRKTMIRDGDGTLYMVPNSQITTVANKTRDYSVATINVDVDFSANPDDVIQVLTKTAMSVRNDPSFKDVFLSDPTLLGVDAMKGSLVTYPVVIKTLANQQWGAKRELQRRIRLALEQNHLLPGDPLRVFTANGPAAVNAAHMGETAAPKADPTAAKSTDINPFTGEGL